MAAVTAAALIFRLIPWLTALPLHRDEALYGYWARLIASGRDPLLLTPWVDKPPLTLYLLAASVRAFGGSELALRLPGMIASLLLVLVTYGFARRAYGIGVALVAAGLLALSPFAILFAPTAFTDPWLTFWLVGAAWAALARRPFLTGVLLGLAVASKQQGVLGVPLVFALLIAQRDNGAGVGTHGGPPSLLCSSAPLLLRSVLGFALIFAPLTYWDSLRWINRPSFWDRSVTTYAPLTLAPLAEWPQRAAEWGEQLGYLFGLPLLSALMLAVAAAVGLRAILMLRLEPRDRSNKKAPLVELNGLTTQSLSRRSVSEASRLTTGLFAGGALISRLRRQPAQSDRRGASAIRVDAILAVYTAGYLALHVTTTVQPWDRYLLPLVPWVCVLAARGFVLVWQRFANSPASIVTANTEKRLDLSAFSAAKPLLLLLLIIPALLWASWLGATGRLPVGSGSGAYAGLDRVITLLQEQPGNTVIYDRWLSWHYDFYLFDAPQERRWWGSGWKLADDAARTARIEPDRPQWAVLPAWETSAAEQLYLPLASRGLKLVEIRRIYRPDNTRSFTVYRIAPLRAEAAP